MVFDIWRFFVFLSKKYYNINIAVIKKLATCESTLGTSRPAHLLN